MASQKTKPDASQKLSGVSADATREGGVGGGSFVPAGRGEVFLVFAVQVPCLVSRWQEDAQGRPEALPSCDWTRPPVPTELIAVLISHTGSVQQEQESSP